MSEHGPILARFEVSAGDQRALAYLRGICGLLALGGAGAMLLGRLSVTLFMVALLAVLLSLAWLAQARRLSQAARAAVRPALTVHTLGLRLEEPNRNEWLAWTDVTRIEVDEERLDVIVTRRDETTLRLEPRYQGVDLHQLVRTLTEAWQSAPKAGGFSAQTDPGASTDGSPRGVSSLGPASEETAGTPVRRW